MKGKKKVTVHSFWEKIKRLMRMVVEEGMKKNPVVWMYDKSVFFI